MMIAEGGKGAPADWLARGKISTRSRTSQKGKTSPLLGRFLTCLLSSITERGDRGEQTKLRRGLASDTRAYDMSTGKPRLMSRKVGKIGAFWTCPRSFGRHLKMF